MKPPIFVREPSEKERERLEAGLRPKSWTMAKWTLRSPPRLRGKHHSLASASLSVQTEFYCPYSRLHAVATPSFSPMWRM